MSNIHVFAWIWCDNIKSVFLILAIRRLKLSQRKKLLLLLTWILSSNNLGKEAPALLPKRARTLTCRAIVLLPAPQNTSFAHIHTHAFNVHIPTKTNLWTSWTNLIPSANNFYHMHSCLLKLTHIIHKSHPS